MPPPSPEGWEGRAKPSGSTRTDAGGAPPRVGRDGRGGGDGAAGERETGPGVGGIGRPAHPLDVFAQFWVSWFPNTKSFAAQVLLFLPMMFRACLVSTGAPKIPITSNV